MALLDFPASPTIGQVYTFGANSWKWNGVGWVVINAGPIGLTGPTGITGPQGPALNATLVFPGAFF